MFSIEYFRNYANVRDREFMLGLKQEQLKLKSQIESIDYTIKCLQRQIERRNTSKTFE